jgi:pyridoxal phosphate enzyme (YggS family)
MIQANVKEIFSELPDGVQLVGAVKTRSAKEVSKAIDAGIQIIGHNYVQEAERMHGILSVPVKWHMIGHLQSNKAKKAVAFFDMIETVDSLKLARAINRACDPLKKTMPILLEINSGEEPQKAGVLPADAAGLAREISQLSHVRLSGLMTMAPFSGDPEDARPYFQKTKRLFNEIAALNLPNVHMEFLSMGMSNSYNVAIEEGANMVRIGTRIFGERG